MHNRLTPFDVFLYGTSVLAWGFSWIAMHYQVGTVAPEVSVVWRFMLAAPLMLAIAWARGERLRFSLIEHGYYAALGATIFSFNFTLFYYASQHIASGLLSIIFSLASIGNVLLAAVVFRAPLDRRVVAGALLGVIGIAAMFYPELAATSVDRQAMIGLALAVTGTLSFCTANMISTAAQRRGLPIFASSGYGMIYGTLLVALVAMLRGETFIIQPTVGYLGSLLYLAVIASVVGFASYFTLLGRIGAERSGYATVMYPVIALVVSTFAEGYRWTWPALVGLIAVLAGNLLVLRIPRSA